MRLLKTIFNKFKKPIEWIEIKLPVHHHKTKISDEDEENEDRENKEDINKEEEE